MPPRIFDPNKHLWNEPDELDQEADAPDAPAASKPSDTFDFAAKGYDPTKFVNPGTRKLFAGEITAATQAKKEQQALDIFDARQMQKAASAKQEAQLRSSGAKIFKDDTGAWQQETDEQGRPLYQPKKGETQYDDKTGRAFREDRDEFGQRKIVEPDANADIGPHPDRPGELYKQNKESGWEYLGTVDDGLRSTDPRIKSAAEAAKPKLDEELHKGAKEGFQAERDQLALDFGAKMQDYNVRSRQVAQADSQIEQLKADPEFSKTEGGFLGSQIGSQPTAAAKILQDKAKALETQRDSIDLSDAPDAKAHKAALTDVKTREQMFDALVHQAGGDVNKASQTWREQIAANGGDPSQDKVLQALRTRREKLGLPALDEAEENAAADRAAKLRADPTLSPIFAKEEAVRADVESGKITTAEELKARTTAVQQEYEAAQKQATHSLTREELLAMPPKRRQEALEMQQQAAQQQRDSEALRTTVLNQLKKERGFDDHQAINAAAAMSPDEVERVARRAGVEEFGSNTFSRAVAQGWLNMGSSVLNFTRIFAETDWAKKNAQHLDALAAEVPQEIQSYKDIHSAADLGSYAVNALGNLAPTMATSMGAGLAVRGALSVIPAVARLAPAATELVQAAETARKAGNVAEALVLTQRAEKIAKFAGQVSTWGTRGGAFIPSFAQEAGGIFGDQEKAGRVNRLAALGFGALAGVLDSLEPANVAERLSRAASKDSMRAMVRDIIVQMGKAAVKDGLLEGSTEGLQTILEKAGLAVAGDNFNQVFSDPNTWTEVVDSTLMGMIGGLGLGGGSAAVETRAEHKAAAKAEALFQQHIKPAADVISALHGRLPKTDDLLAQTPDHVSPGAAELGAQPLPEGTKENLQAADAEIGRLQTLLNDAEKAGDIGQRNALTAQLAQTQQGKIQLASHALIARDFEAAASDIEAMQPGEGETPEQVEQAKTIARGLVKIATGKVSTQDVQKAIKAGPPGTDKTPGVAVDPADDDLRMLVHSQTPDGKPRVTIEDGQPVIADTAVQRLAERAPAAGDLVQSLHGGEDEQRARILEQKGGENQNGQKETGQANADAEGQGREGLLTPAAEGSSPAAEPPEDAQIIEHFAQEAMRQVPGLQPAHARKAAKLIAKPLALYAKAFEAGGIHFEADARESGGARSTKRGNITFSIADLLDPANAARLASPKAAQALIDEEAIHSIVRQVLFEEAVAGGMSEAAATAHVEAQMANFWNLLAPEDQAKVRRIYELGQETAALPDEALPKSEMPDSQLGHEAFRMWMQGEITESHDPALMQWLRLTLSKVIKWLGGLVERMRANGADEAHVAKFEALRKEVLARRKEILVAGRAAQPYGEANEQTSDGIQKAGTTGSSEVVSKQGGAGAPAVVGTGEDVASTSRVAAGASETGSKLSDAATTLPIERFAPVAVPLASLAVQKDVPNFKRGADAKTGIIEPLPGEKYDHVGPPIQVWQKANGEMEVASGRHRVEKARRLGETHILAQVLRESDGWTLDKIMLLDAEQNIKDEKGTVEDYARFFRNANITEEQAVPRGLLGARGLRGTAKARAGWSLGRDATDNLYALYTGDKLSEAKALAIAQAAPGNEKLQAVGVHFALVTNPEADAQNVGARVQAASAFPEIRQAAEQDELFGADDSAMQAMNKAAQAAIKFQREAARDVGILSAARNKSQALKLTDEEMARFGITDKNDQAQIDAALEKAKALRDSWENWHLNPERKQQVIDAVKAQAAEALNSRTTARTPRIVALDRKRTDGSITQTELRELERLERNAGQGFLEFFDTTRSSPDLRLEGESGVYGNSHAPEQMALLSRAAQIDPRLRKAFGDDWEYGWNSLGVPNQPHTLERAGRADLLTPTDQLKDATLTADSRLVQLNIFRPGTYTRQRIRTAILRHFLQGGTGSETADHTPEPQSAPDLLMLGGGGGAGKSSILRAWQENNPLPQGGRVLVNADEIRELIPEYHRINELGDARSSAITHEESSAISKEVLRRAMMERYNIVFDGTLANKEKAMRMMDEAEAHGYNLRMIGVTIDPMEALVRAYKRASETKRYVPDETLLEAHRGFNDAAPDYARRLGERAAFFDNSSAPQQIPVDRVATESYGLISERSKINPRGKIPEEVNNGDVRVGDELPADSDAGEVPRGPDEGRSEAGREDGPELKARATSAGARLFIGNNETLEEAFSSDGNSVFLLTKSAKNPGQWQATEFMVEDGALRPVGDSQFENPSEAIAQFKDRNYQAITGPSVARAFEAVPLASRKKSAIDPNQGGFDFEKPLTEEAANRKESTKETSNVQPAATTPKTNRRNAAKPAPDGGMDDLFQRLVGHQESGRSAGVAGGAEGGHSATRGQSDLDLFADAENTSAADRRGDAELPAGGGAIASTGDAVRDAGRTGGGSGTADGGGDAEVGSDSGRSDRQLRERPADPAARNFSIPRGTEVSPRGLTTKLRANIAAIRLLKTIESEKRNATPEEKAELVKYSGWGALSQAFDESMADRIHGGEIEQRRATAERYRSYGEGEYYRSEVENQEREANRLEAWRDKWGQFHTDLKAELTNDEFQRAMRSTINAHYTSPEIISAMWDVAERLGFKGGNVLEPAAGVGHFFGLMPERLVERSHQFAVELDDLSGRITKLLYPEADVQVTGFQNADVADNSIDLAISNVPFANVPVTDPALETMGGPTNNLHDYFFGKTLTKLRPGGLALYITSAFTMDKGNAENRKWLADHADLVAAFRLPNDAFEANAGTSVVTDVIVLRKKDGTHFEHAQDWLQLDNAQTSKGDTIRVNQYFTAHPQNILGLLDNDGSMYGDKEEMTVHSDPNRPAKVALQQAIEALPEGIAGEQSGNRVRTGAVLTTAKFGNIVERDGKFSVEGSQETDEALNDPKNRRRVLDFMTVRDALNRQYDLELSDATDEAIETNRERLNAAYDKFVAAHKPLHHRLNHALFAADPDYFRLMGAEIAVEGDTPEARRKAPTYTKADVFNRRVLAPRSEPIHADNLQDAFGISLGWRGRVDAGFIAELTGQSREQVERGLVEQEIAVRDPQTGQILSREQYLSGNVRQKLAIARAAGPDYARNARMLETVQPQDVGADDIRFKIGATWIPADVYKDFAAALGIADLRITYHTGQTGASDYWEVNAKRTRHYGVEYKDYATASMSVPELMDAMLNMRRIQILHDGKENKGQVNVAATQAARDAAKKLNEAFVGWAKKNRGEQLAEIYNREVNAHAQRTYDGQFLTLPWANKDFDLFPEKKNVIWRAIQDGFGLIAHGVGGGKTIIGTAVALEMRRLGMARKPMLVVHNATLEQFAEKIAEMAPHARVLVGRKDELSGEKRKEFLMRIAAGDWDAVVLAHSTFGLIEDDPVFQKKHMQSLIDEIMTSLNEEGFHDLDEAAKAGRTNRSVKDRVKSIERLEEKIAKLSERRTDSGLLNFQQLGVDALIVDEVHKFKKMPFSTKLDVKGIDPGFSQRGYGLLMRARSIQERMGGKNVFTMTGTPVTNTLGEVWNMVRLVAPHLLTEYGVEHFDQFVSKFAEVETVSEQQANGEFKAVERLAKVVNLPEWATFLRLAADVKLGDELAVKNRPGIKGGKPELISVERTPGVTAWVSYIRKVLAGFENLGKEDFDNNPGLIAIPVQAYMASRAAAIDIRLIDPRAEDEPGSKVNRMIEEAMRIYERSTGYKGTQAIFADSFHNVKTGIFSGVTSPGELYAGLKLDLDKPKGDFNLYEDIKAKLIARGVPASEIAIIGDYNTDKARTAVFEKVKTGEVRFIMGSTEKLGTGVNMQDLMAAGHHLDVPWTPAGLEQRDGRVFRQGNIHASMGIGVELPRYGMKDSLDAALWQKLETKQRFITLALSGKIIGRELEEIDEILSLAEQRAILSGPYGQELFETENRIRELSASEQGHDGNARSRKLEISSAKAGLSIEARENEARKPAMEAMRALGEKVARDGATITLNGESFATKTAMVEAVNAELEKAKAAENPVYSIRVNGDAVRLVPIKDAFSDKISFKITATVGEAVDFGRVTSAATLLSRLEELKETVEGMEIARRNNLRRLEQIAAMNEMAPWPHQAELDAAKKRRIELQNIIGGKKTEAAPDDGQTPLLSRATTPHEDGKLTANERIVKYIDLARRIARSWTNIPGVQQGDVEQHAKMALVQAARAYDPMQGPFENYAGVAIRNRLKDLYSKQDHYASHFSTTLDEPMGEDNDETRMASVRDTGASVTRDAAEHETTDLLDSLISELPQNLRDVVEGIRRGEEQGQIAKRLGLGTKQAVGNRAKIAMTRLRQKLGERGITSYEGGALNARKTTTPGQFDPYEAIKQLQELAKLETSGQRTIGAPRFGYSTQTPEQMGVDQYYDKTFQSKEFKAMQADAQKLVDSDREGTQQAIIKAAMSGTGITAEQTFAAQKIHADLLKSYAETGNEDLRRQAQQVWLSYRQARGDVARALASGRDLLKTPAERHREFLGRMILTPPKDVQKQLDEAKTPEERKKILDADQKRIDNILAQLAKMGVSEKDLFSGEVELRIKGARMNANIVAEQKGKEQEIARMINQRKTLAEIMKATGADKTAVEAVRQKAIEALKKRLLPKLKAGTPLANIDLTALKARATELSDAEADALFEKAVESLGWSAPSERETFDITNPEHVVKVARAIQAIGGGKFDMLYEAWINGILSGPQTQVVNIAGNAANAGWDMTVQRGLEALVNAAFIHDPKSAQLGELTHLARGLLPGIARGLRLGAIAWRTESDFFRHDVLGEPIAFEDFDKGGNVRAAIPGKTGRVIRIPGRALLFADSFFKGVIGQMQAGAEAFRIGKAEGLKGKALESRIADLVMTKGSEAWHRATEKATELTFQESLKTAKQGGNAIEDIAAKVQSARPDNPILGFIIPFVRTPFNIFRIGLRKSPLGSIPMLTNFAKAGFYKIKDGKPVGESYLPARQVRDMAEQLIAWTTIALLYGATQGDPDDDDKQLLITGSMPRTETSRGERELATRAYGGDYIIRIGGRHGVTIPYGRIEPFATVIGTTVDALRQLKSKEPSAEKLDAMWAYFVAQAQSKTFLQGIGNIVDTMQNSKGVADAVKKSVLQAIVPNLIRSPLRSLDDWVRDSKGASAEYQMFPAGELAEKRADVYGHDTEKSGTALSRILFPAALKPYEQLENADKLLMNWNRENPSAKWAPTPPPRTYKDNKGKEQTMTEGQYRNYSSRVGHRVIEALHGKISSRQIAKPDEEDVKAIRAAFEDARRDVKAAMFPRVAK